MSFTARRYKDELVNRDMDELKAVKTSLFGRDEVCDEVYFKQQRRVKV